VLVAVLLSHFLKCYPLILGDSFWFGFLFLRFGFVQVETGVPKLTLGLLQEGFNGKSLVGCVLEVVLAPSGQ
jgi:hypothetical protein